MPPLEQNTIGNGGDRAAVRSLTFDDITVTYVVDGVIALRPEVFFPAVPADAWTELVTAGGELLMSAGGLLVEIAGSTVLIDAGVGRMTETLSFGGVDCGSLIDVLGALGVPPGDIDVVAFTHLHFDHAGWHSPMAPKPFPTRVTWWRPTKSRRTAPPSAMTIRRHRGTPSHDWPVASTTS